MREPSELPFVIPAYKNGLIMGLLAVPILFVVGLIIQTFDGTFGKVLVVGFLLACLALTGLWVRQKSGNG